MYFRDIIGQEKTKDRLRLSVRQGQIAHAQLFAGNEGAGKLQLALAYARYIQCTNRGELDSCGNCPSCVKYNKLVHPDLHFVYPVVKRDKSSISTDFLPEWRAFVLENGYFSLRQWLELIGKENQQGGIFVDEADQIISKLQVKPYESDYRVMLIWLPEKMNDQTANKLLKMLEEPYEKTVFLLVSNQPDMVLGTILSRTQRIQIPPVDESDLREALENKYYLSPVHSERIAHLASGSVLQALQNITVSEEQTLLLELFKQMMRLAYGRKLKEMKLWSEEVAALGREKQKVFLQYAQHMIRESFIYNLQNPQLTYMNSEEEAFSSRFSPFVNEKNTAGIMAELELAEVHITQNVNAKMVFFDLALKFIMLLKTN